MGIELKQLIHKHPFEPPEIPARMVWTASSLKQFRKCKRKFFWKYLMRLRSKFRDKNLAIGSAFHNCVAEWYRAKRMSMGRVATKYVNELQQYTKVAGDYFNQDDIDRLQILVDSFKGMMLGYEEMYARDRVEWRIDRTSIEKQFVVDMGDFDFAGKVDLVASDKDGSFLVEHKTASSIRDSYIDRLPLDTQVRGYVFGARRGLGLKPRDVLYDVVRKSKLRRKSNEDLDTFGARVANDYLARPDFNFFRERLLVSKDELAAFEHEVHQTHREFRTLTQQSNWKDKEFWKWLVGADQRDATDPRAWLPNDAVCDEYFKACPYLKLCNIGLDSGTAVMLEQGTSLHEELDLDEE